MRIQLTAAAALVAGLLSLAPRAAHADGLSWSETSRGPVYTQVDYDDYPATWRRAELERRMERERYREARWWRWHHWREEREREARWRWYHDRGGYQGWRD